VIVVFIDFPTLPSNDALVFSGHLNWVALLTYLSVPGSAPKPWMPVTARGDGLASANDT
jgi:hypothetical protein